MLTHPLAIPRVSHRILANSVIAALGLAVSIVEASGAIVTTCDDTDLPGSLRYEVAHAVNGETIDLSQLPMTCSKITLDPNKEPSEIRVSQDTLYFKGPGADKLAIDATAHSSVIRHIGTGRLDISDLTITNGQYESNVLPSGGCIFSSGSVYLTRSIVSKCLVGSNAVPALGGGVYSQNNLTLTSSTITQSRAVGIGVTAKGGGVFAFGDLTAKYSTVSGNEAINKYSGASLGGGAATHGNVIIKGSTISGNRADFSGGIEIGGYNSYSATISNSTISENVAGSDYGGLRTNTPLTIANSTIAFNRSDYFRGAGVFSFGAPVTLQGSIIANNTAFIDGPNDIDGEDVGMSVAAITANSSNNLVVFSNLQLPMGTIRDCPRLEPLSDNGGPTRTHGLQNTSPALDKGNNTQNLVTDQRLAARVVNADADIGAVEWQSSDKPDRILISGFDGGCDS